VTGEGGTLRAILLVISIVFTAKYAATSTLGGWLPLAHPLHYLSALRQLRRKQTSGERSKSMKVKTNTQAGNALWGS
jgi:hypothetical protein